jgi:hypothetical protein
VATKCPRTVRTDSVIFSKGTRTLVTAMPNIGVRSFWNGFWGSSAEMIQDAIAARTTPQPSTAFEITRNNETWTFWVTDGTNFGERRIMAITPEGTVEEPHRVYDFDNTLTLHELMLGAAAIARLVFKLGTDDPPTGNDKPSTEYQWDGDVQVETGEQPRKNEFVECVAKCLEAVMNHNKGYQPCNFVDATKLPKIPSSVMKSLDKDCSGCTITMTTREDPHVTTAEYKEKAEWQVVDENDAYGP